MSRMSKPLGVGLLGAGPATQAIHLPVIASLHDRLRVVTVMDVDATLAGRVADRCSARATTRVSDVTEDPSVDIVVVCSPNRFHAEQVIAACGAGKRAVLCEKPLATTVEEANRIAATSAATGVPVIVGTMHAFDPAYAAARRNWGDLPETATLVRSVIYLPSNDGMVGLATDPVTATADAAASLPDAQTPSIRAAILGLAIHAIPLIRVLAPDPGPVSFARFVEPSGYSVTCTNGDRAVQLIGFMPGSWAPDWTLRAWGGDRELSIDFPPSYVLAGSAVASLTAGGQNASWRYPRNGYEAEWEHVADLAQGRAEPGDSLGTAVSDLVCAITIADQASAFGCEAA
jgi:myo-inositol 2-dehydrogenase / D-chiro-inositol 1-dehydrogenase